MPFPRQRCRVATVLFRRKIPSDLRDRFGCGEIVRSLGRVTAGEGRRLAHHFWSQTEMAFMFDRPAPDHPQPLCLDKGYDDAEPRRLAADLGFTLHLRSRGEECEAKRYAGAKTRRWVVERAHAWTNRFRALLVR